MVERPDPDTNSYIRDPDTDFAPVDTLNPERAREQAAQLRDAIRYHDHRYYVENDPVIADRTYDALFDRLATLEDTFDLQTPDSPTQRIGGEPLDALPEAEHVRPMRSVEAVDDTEGVRAFDARMREQRDDVAYVCEPKFDGLSIEVIYEEGRYQRAATRGDGTVGEDVTEAVRTIPAVPQRLRGDYPAYLAVRGEIYMPREAFQAYN
ncbi:MAG: NAD-dependent DNA ligase LigA, partial [Salinarchaeum sp.]